MNATRSCFSSFDSFKLQYEVEELDGVLQGQAAAVVQVRRAILDAAEREALDRAVARLAFQESLQVQVVHLVVEVGRRRVADRALRLAEEQLLAAQLALGRLLRVEAAQRGQLGAGGKSSMFCIWAMCDTWMRSRMFIPFLMA